MKHFVLALILMGMGTACSSNPLAKNTRVLLDSSGPRPEWIISSQIVSETDKSIAFRSQATIRGDERVGSCIDISRMQAQERILTEIQTDVRGALSQAQTAPSEAVELLLTRSLTSDFSGRLRGIRTTNEYYERYRIGETERIECYTLNEIRKADFERIRQELVNRVVSADPAVKAALSQRQSTFFNKSE